ncbi:hypothetical protein pb186bvf_006090 [Paramecium bursaria]
MWQKKIDSKGMIVVVIQILRWSRTFHLALLITLASKRKTHSQLDLYKKFNDLAFHLFQIVADISDFLLWICQIGLCKNLNILKKAKEFEPKFYLIESSWWIFTLAYEYILIKENANRKKQIKFNIIRYFLDMLVSVALVYQNISPEKTVIIGSVSSLMGVYQIFCV